MLKNSQVLCFIPRKLFACERKRDAAALLTRSRITWPPLWAAYTISRTRRRAKTKTEVLTIVARFRLPIARRVDDHWVVFVGNLGKFFSLKFHLNSSKNSSKKYDWLNHVLILCIRMRRFGWKGREGRDRHYGIWAAWVVVVKIHLYIEDKLIEDNSNIGIIVKK